MKENYEAVLFDMDGVLIESFEAWHSSVNDTLKHFNKDPISKEKYREDFWGPEIREVMDGIGVGKRGFDYWKSNLSKYVKNIKIYPETKRILGSINKKIGLVTSAPENQLRETLNHFELEEFFDAIVHGDEVDEPKPAPEPILRACNKLDVNPENSLFMGDTRSDYKAGKSAGCTVVGVGVEGDIVIDRLEELPDVVPSIFR